MTSRQSEVAFAAEDGTVLRGWLYRPPTSPVPVPVPVPGIVMSHGFSATRGMGLPGHAAAFAAAGLAVLLYDHRSLGDSDGAPRRLVDPFVQTRDMMAAVGWLAAQPGVAADRIGLWGTSYSGGEALVLAALDPRVRAVATIVPSVGGVGVIREDPHAAWAALAARVTGAAIDADAVAGPRAVVPEAGGLAVALMPDPDTAAWMLREGVATEGRWRNEVLTPARREDDIAFDPAPALRFLHAPVLMIAGDADRVTPAADTRVAADVAGDAAEFLLLPGHHCSFYAGEPRERAIAAALDFYRRRL